jgi:hypothetical protein
MQHLCGAFPLHFSPPPETLKLWVYNHIHFTACRHSATSARRLRPTTLRGLAQLVTDQAVRVSRGSCLLLVWRIWRVWRVARLLALLARLLSPIYWLGVIPVVSDGRGEGGGASRIRSLDLP